MEILLSHIQYAYNLREVRTKYIMAYLLKARNVEPAKQPLLGNGCVTRNNGVTVGIGIFCAVRAEAILRESLETAVRRVGLSCGTVASR
jgi:hypothetical protein